MSISQNAFSEQTCSKKMAVAQNHERTPYIRNVDPENPRFFLVCLRFVYSALVLQYRPDGDGIDYRKPCWLEPLRHAVLHSVARDGCARHRTITALCVYTPELPCGAGVVCEDYLRQSYCGGQPPLPRKLDSTL